MDKINTEGLTENLKLRDDYTAGPQIRESNLFWTS